MGIWSSDFNAWLNAVFEMMFVTGPPQWEYFSDARVLIVDGSLFYRAGRQWTDFITWQDWMDDVFARLDAVLARFPALTHVVYRLDMYGSAHVVAADAKDACHLRRYGPPAQQPAAPPAHVLAAQYRADAPVAGITTTETFGQIARRLALNSMFSHGLAVRVATLLRDARPGITFILDGMCADMHVLHQPMVCAAGTRDVVPYVHPPHCPEPCLHSEGDIGIAHWLNVFSDQQAVVHSCDTDILLVCGFHVRRLADGGLPWGEVPDVYMLKVVGGREWVIAIKTLVLLANSVFGTYSAAPDTCAPLELLGLLLTTCGNDFCEPYGIGADARAAGSPHNGVEFAAVVDAYFRFYHRLGPLLDSRADTRAPLPYGVQRVPTNVYQIRVCTERWHALLLCALERQRACTRRTVADERLLYDADYIHSQTARACWALHYYANAALPGYAMPRGDEADAGVSRHGWARDDATQMLLPVFRVHRRHMHHGGAHDDAPTECPPSPSQ